MKEKTMYRVEKFSPTECPYCHRQFLQEGKDWVRLYGRIVDGKKVITETTGYLLIICQGCDNDVEMVPLESYQLGDKKEAERLCKEEGFVNLIEVTACGTATKDSHAVYPPGSVKVRAIKCEEE